jgi:hypothetical protein
MLGFSSDSSGQSVALMELYPTRFRAPVTMSRTKRFVRPADAPVFVPSNSVAVWKTANRPSAETAGLKPSVTNFSGSRRSPRRETFTTRSENRCRK